MFKALVSSLDKANRQLFSSLLRGAGRSRLLAVSGICVGRSIICLSLPLLLVTVPTSSFVLRSLFGDNRLTRGLDTFWSRIKYAFRGHPKPLLKRSCQLRRYPSMLEHPPAPVPLGSPGRHCAEDLLIIDNFYEDPDAVRSYALDLDYLPYRRSWFSSSLLNAEHQSCETGVRLANQPIREELERLLSCRCDVSTWDVSGDGMNGAFHLKFKDYLPWASSAIHNHTGRDEDVRDGWSGLVYLNPDCDPSKGTSIWRHRKTGKCYSADCIYSFNLDEFESVLVVENVYNRLVMFRASIIHMGEEGFGYRRQDARLFQTFFFNASNEAS